jgi:hypothetical protein
MTEPTPSLDRPPKWVRIVARIWSAPIILFVVFFLLGNLWSELTNGGPDPYAVGETTTLELLPPIFFAISALGLALAWRWEIIGGIFSLAFTAAAVLTLLIQVLMADELSRLLIPLLMALIILVPGMLFLIFGLRSRKV